MSNKEYRITIAIPAYKNVETLKRAIDSVIDLKKEDGIEWSLLISEDYSENHDKIETLIKNYTCEKIKYVYHKPKLGMTENWNFCIESSETECVALLHDDDYLLPDYLHYVKKVLDSKYNWECVSFAHEFLVDGKLENKIHKGLKKFYNAVCSNKIRKVQAMEYLLGGYNYIVIPTCGILFNKNSMLQFGGYLAKDGFSADERFFERFCRAGGKIYFYNAKVAVYTYTTNGNLSSNHSIQREFVLENIEHRKEIKNQNRYMKKLINYFDECMTLYQVGEWRKVLIPEMDINTKLKIKYCIFILICRIYQYSKILKYKRI